MTDLRLYTYSGDGVLRKNSKRRYRSMPEIMAAINRYKSMPGRISWQFVIIEYTGSYESKIIKVI